MGSYSFLLTTMSTSITLVDLDITEDNSGIALKVPSAKWDFFQRNGCKEHYVSLMVYSSIVSFVTNW